MVGRQSATRPTALSPILNTKQKITREKRVKEFKRGFRIGGIGRVANSRSKIARVFWKGE